MNVAPGGATRVAAVIGHPVRHSRSPAMHNAAFAAAGVDATFVAFEVAPGAGGRAVDAMRALGLLGLSVTMPHKADAARAVDRCTEAAARLGAVNTVYWDGDDLVGDSTDGAGFVDAMAELGVVLDGAPVVVLGAGGAARAVALAAAATGARVAVCNRTLERAHAVAALDPAIVVAGAADVVPGAAVVVNATPVGMAGTAAAGELPLDPGLLRADQVVVDLVYEPLRTPLLEAAAAANARPVDGLGMLVHQAAHAFRRWTGLEAPLGAMHRAARSDGGTGHNSG